MISRHLLGSRRSVGGGDQHVRDEIDRKVGEGRSDKIALPQVKGSQDAFKEHLEALSRPLMSALHPKRTLAGSFPPAPPDKGPLSQHADSSCVRRTLRPEMHG